MPSSSPSSKFVQFGVFELDLQRGQLRRNGARVRLQEQPLKVLQLLLENPGQIVNREQLRSRIWPANTYVEFDQGLYSAVARLRDALGDSSESPRFIETVARRGYRFIAPINESHRPETTEVPATSRIESRARRFVLSVLAGLLGGACLLAVFLSFNLAGVRERLRRRQDFPIRSLAVLPLVNLSGDPEQDYFADGMTDELITDLAQLHNLRVISRTSVMRYKKSERTLPEIGRELNVDAVVEGTVARSANRVRIRVQLVRVADDRHLWAQAYEREFQNVLLLQSDAAHEIAEQVGISVVKPQKGQTADRNSFMKPEAYESYLRGRFYAQTGKPEDAQKAKAYFQQAIQQDPQAALAYSELAGVYIYETYIGTYIGASRKEAAAKARSLASKALELKPDLAAPHLTMTGIAEIDWDWAEAERQYRRALELEPGSSEAHLLYGMFLAAQGRFKESIPETQIALQLDPVSARTHAASGFTYYLAGDYDRAIEESKRVLELDPEYEDAHANLFYSYIQKGMYDKAVEEFRKFAAMWRYPQESVDAIEDAYRRAGIRAFWDKQIELNASRRIPPLDSLDLASIHALVGENAKALEYLEKAWEERDPKMGFIRVLPELASLHSEPKFQDLVNRMRLSGQ